ncbi:Transposon Ty3-I Gag-Pol polyprotein [Vitis vinifera]|uniref:Transposon Ty3-I Gag-Pol polyprotein n=1 Tax=Vitis vinifera TaxID=29760 RepID=A0A438GTZ9_VITVI|nr:Transposon Ty3-I Gag-Pol polyprotein [Vitis vinifera]
MIEIHPSVASHRLNILPSSRPVREVEYPNWLANAVVVPKKERKWQVCVDYTNLNNACLKDSFPLPRIDQIVDSTAGQGMLSFLYAFFGYHQIPMTPADEEKIAFITPHELYCYKIMPFGLKNVDATYQRLMTKIFKPLVGRTVEVYIDDIVVKSKTREDHVHHLQEVFHLLRRYDMKLNPSKCAFGSNGRCRDKIFEDRANYLGLVKCHSETPSILPSSPGSHAYRPALPQHPAQARSNLPNDLLKTGNRTRRSGGPYKSTEPLGRQDPGWDCYYNLQLANIRLGFPALNNEAESEAILSELDLGLALSVSKLRIYNDSQLVVRHVQEEYKAKDEHMTSYLTKVRDTLQRLGPYLRCLDRSEAQYILAKLHEGVCGNHSEGRSLAHQAHSQGYYWPMKKNVAAYVKKYYFSKWVEAEAYANIKDKDVTRFIWKNIICRFGIPQAIIADNGPQFDSIAF